MLKKTWFIRWMRVVMVLICVDVKWWFVVICSRWVLKFCAVLLLGGIMNLMVVLLLMMYFVRYLVVRKLV